MSFPYDAAADDQRRLAKRKYEACIYIERYHPYRYSSSLSINNDNDSRLSKRRATESTSRASDLTTFQGNKSLFLFVRIMSGKSLTFVVNSYDTVMSLHETIQMRTCMPVKDQRLVYGGRQLDVNKRFGDYGIQKDSTLQLVGRLPSGRNPEVWQIVDNLVFSAICLCQGDDSGKINHAEDIRISMSKFLSWVRDDNSKLGICHLRIFTSLSAVDALSMLYLSANDRSKHVGYNLIRNFLISIHGFPKELHTYAATMVLGFCKNLDKAGLKDLLYYSCRSTLGSLVGGAAVVKVFSYEGSLSLPDIFPFLLEVGDSLSKGFSNGAGTFSEWELFSHFREFALFLKPVLAYKEGPINMPLQRGEMLMHLFGKEIAFLHSILLELRGIMCECFKRVECSFREDGESKFKNDEFQYLLILKQLNTLSKIYRGETDNFSKMLRQNIIPLRALILRCTKCNEDNNWLLEHKEVLDFECRRHLAMMMFPEIKEEYDEIHEMLIDRSNLLAESFEYIFNAEPETLRNGLFMEFKNEEATGPGVVREWFFLVCKEMFNPQNALFIANPNDLTRFYINPASEVDPKHHDYFRVCGRVIALALTHKVQVGIVFDRVFFMQLAGYSVQLKDIKDTDPILYRSCKHILEMDADLLDSDCLGLTFVREYEELGLRKRAELIPGGEGIKLNSVNRVVYVEALIQSHFSTATKQQVAHFAQGFGDILSDPKLQSFFFRSLELEDLDWMLRGNKCDLSIEDWKLHTKYIGYCDTDPQISWFWKIVEEMAEGQRINLLSFWTSVRYLPVEGFGGLLSCGLPSPLFILKTEGTTDHLPSSHTCFYQLCIPQYPTLAMMKDRFNLITQDYIGSSFGTP